MDLINTARAIGGLLTIITLLGMVVAQFVYPDLSIQPATIHTLLGLIGALLGLDILRQRAKEQKKG